ncbi:MAG: ABC transporter ATP-binding protein [Eubacteriales bacterium]|nr:ABC transporter ATP-binding protein [Eubacteriales bacterium]
MLLEALNLSKTYKTSAISVHALRGVSFVAEPGDLTVILGKSGSGKSTFLDVIGGILEPDQGKVIFNGYSLYEETEEKRTELRRTGIGYIFQNFNLIDEFTVLENVRLPLDISGGSYDLEYEYKIFSMLGIENRVNFYPDQLSGGERQRTAIARALIMKPQLILADEPTGNLDSQTSRQFMDFVRLSNQELRQSFVVVTHDREWSEIAGRAYYMKDGCLEVYHE